VPPLDSGRNQPTYNLERPAELSVEEARSLPLTSGVAEEYKGHKAMIMRNQTSAWSSGPSMGRGWSIKMAHSSKWTNGLMGWLSGDATVEQPCALVSFDTPEQAVLFCERNGWPYEVIPEPADRLPIAVNPRGPGNQYSYNILPLAVQKAIKTAGAKKAGKTVFAHPTAPASTGVSTWVNWRHTGYGPDPWKPRNDKIKFDQSAWTGPDWAPVKEIPPPGADANLKGEDH
jgi:hypothetical protein